MLNMLWFVFLLYSTLTRKNILAHRASLLAPTCQTSPLHGPQRTLLCPAMPQHALLFPSVPCYAPACPAMPQHALICPSMTCYAPSMPCCALLCSSMSGYAPAHPAVPCFAPALGPMGAINLSLSHTSSRIILCLFLTGSSRHPYTVT